ncbi:hypothetical protein PVAP13_2KG508200 [Panicum virgatum]|uniref:Uncharacterized protein n=1 Tax=Panicum virgatum TaxID=38727 RepID=A0A8T0WK36_PANVG|nr:hypothetical protein PVAP13_2KG508200 [Panicum virgatum]
MPPPSSTGPLYWLTMNPTYQSINAAVKVLSLAAFALTRELIQKVRRSRALVLARSPPPEPGLVPGEAKVFVYHSAAHLLLFVLVVARYGQTITIHHGAAPRADAGPVPAAAGDRQRRVARPRRQASRGGLLPVPGRHRRAPAAARVRLLPAPAGGARYQRHVRERHPVRVLPRRRRGGAGRVRLACARCVRAAEVEPHDRPSHGRVGAQET